MQKPAVSGSSSSWAGDTQDAARLRSIESLFVLGLLLGLRLHADPVVLQALPPEELREAPTQPKIAPPKTALPDEDRSSAPLEFVL